MANRSMLMTLAGAAGLWMMAGTGGAQAAPPRCENITVDDLRQACIDRVARCEPLKSAAERDDCYRGRAPKTADAGTGGPIKLTPNAAPKAPAFPPAPSAAPSGAPSGAPSTAPAPVQPPASPAPAAPVRVTPPAPVQPSPPPPASSAVVVRPGQPAATPAPIPQPAPSADPAPVSRPPVPAPSLAPSPAPAPAAVPRALPGDGVDVVRSFYAALAQGDGARANRFVVPEKRNSGAYDIASMSRYYGNMREPVRLLGAEPMGGDAVRVRYHYVYANGRVCDGGAEVALSRRDGLPLIERIRALNGC